VLLVEISASIADDPVLWSPGIPLKHHLSIWPLLEGSITVDKLGSFDPIIAINLEYAKILLN
jgi:hypothetical protein